MLSAFIAFEIIIALFIAAWMWLIGVGEKGPTIEYWNYRARRIAQHEVRVGASLKITNTDAVSPFMVKYPGRLKEMIEADVRSAVQKMVQSDQAQFEHDLIHGTGMKHPPGLLKMDVIRDAKVSAN